MKINKKKPEHWFTLIKFSLFVLISIPFRPLLRLFKKKPVIILYGHKLCGNLEAIKTYIESKEFNVEIFFLTMDSEYYQNKPCFLYAQNFFHILKVASSDCIISSHGLHSLIFYLKITNIKFYDVWHGIPFKGFDQKDFLVQHHYDETWIASPLLFDVYKDRFGFDPKKIIITGYARTDKLIKPNETPFQIRERMGLNNIEGKKLILFAPTWKQDSKNRSIFPFNTSAEQFVESVSKTCQQHNAVLLFRAHLNTFDLSQLSQDHVISLPFAQYPDTEALLQISDILICDWSSIAFDYLLLNRPTLFLDVEPPFKKGFSLGPEYRFGPIAKDLPELINLLEKSLTIPNWYRDEFGEQQKNICNQVYDKYADGNSAERCLKRLENLIK